MPKKVITNEEEIAHPSSRLLVQRLRNQPDKLCPQKHTVYQQCATGTTPLPEYGHQIEALVLLLDGLFDTL